MPKDNALIEKWCANTGMQLNSKNVAYKIRARRWILFQQPALQIVKMNVIWALRSIQRSHGRLNVKHDLRKAGVRSIFWRELFLLSLRKQSLTFILAMWLPYSAMLVKSSTPVKVIWRKWKNCKDEKIPLFWVRLFCPKNIAHLHWKYCPCRCTLKFLSFLSWCQWSKTKTALSLVQAL